MSDSRPIGFFDSGLGGLTVFRTVRRFFPHENIVYLGDTARLPYGTKSSTTIRRYTEQNIQLLLKCDVKAIVVACNTATSVAVREMRHRYNIPIIGMEPAAKKALDLDGEHRVLVAATPITVHGKKMQILIDRFDKDHLVDLLPLPRLVEFAEREEFRSEAVHAYLAQELGRFHLADYSALVLGCTHFNYFKDTMREIMPENMHFVDGNEGTVRELIRQLDARHALEKLPQTVDYYYSGRRVEDPAELARIARYLKRLDFVYDIR